MSRQQTRTEGLTRARNTRCKNLPAFTVPAPTPSLQPSSISAKPVSAPQNTIPHSQRFFSLESSNKNTYCPHWRPALCPPLLRPTAWGCLRWLPHLPFWSLSFCLPKWRVTVNVKCSPASPSRKAKLHTETRSPVAQKPAGQFLDKTESVRFSQVLPSPRSRILSLASAPSPHSAAKHKAQQGHPRESTSLPK